MFKHRSEWMAHVGVDSLCIHDDATIHTYQDFAKSLTESPDQEKAVRDWFSGMTGTQAKDETKDLVSAALQQCRLEEIVAMVGAIEKHSKVKPMPPTVLFESGQYFSESPKYSWLSLYPESKRIYFPESSHFFFLDQYESFNDEFKQVLESIKPSLPI